MAADLYFLLEEKQMKFNGEKIQAMATREVVIPRPDGNHLVMLVRALGRGEEREAAKLFPEPDAPRGFMKDEKGMPLRDLDTGKVVADYLFNDPGYLAGMADAEDLRFIYKFACAIDQDSRITFDTSAKGADRVREIQKEIQAAGITDGDIALVMKEAIMLGNLDAGALQRAAEAFSEREQAQAQAKAQ
jgi:hypothetical protein